jgi:stage III sporulation protein AF
MDFLSSWVTNIIIFVLLATVIDMLLPNSAMKKYAKMVISLLLIMVILSPILTLFQTDFDQLLVEATDSFQGEVGDQTENLTEIKKKEIQATQDAYILEQTVVLMKTEVEEELKNEYHVKIEQMDINVTDKDHLSLPDDLQKISIVLQPAEEANQTVETIAKVEIDTETSLSEPTTDYGDVKDFLAAQWSVDKKVIELSEERGE